MGRPALPKPGPRGLLSRMAADGLAVSFLGLIAAIASVSGARLVFFPELGALAYDVFRRPRGAWARAPVYLAFTPAVTAVLE